MLPDNSLIEQTDKVFVGPRNKRAGLAESYELGGVAVSDTSEPFIYEWRGYVKDGAIYVARKGEPPVAILEVAGAVTEVSITFDQNMRTTVAYVEDGVAKLYWYNSQTASMTITEFADATNPRVSLDDKRKFNISNSDIILAYISKGNTLCYRLQRERYDIEHVILADSGLRLYRVGMGTENRFLFETN